MASAECHDQSALVRSNSSTSSSGGSKQEDVEPVEVTLLVGEDTTDITESTQTTENKALLDDLNVNPHHNTLDECLDCSCEETTLQGNLDVEIQKKKLCRNCSLEPKSRTQAVKESSQLSKSLIENENVEQSGSNENCIAPHVVVTETSSLQQNESSAQLNDLDDTASSSNFIVDTEDIAPIMTQPLPMTATVSNYCPPGLEDLLEVTQLVIHKSNFRKNIDISKTAVAKLEVVDISRKVVLFAEREPPPISSKSFVYKLYNADQRPVMEVYCPLGKTCVCCGANWHMCRCCKLQAMVSAPPGQIIGFIRREHTKFVQEYHILNPSEDLIFILRGGPLDLEIYTPTLGDELGRLARHNWVGIMREIKRSAEDYGITFPMDLDVRVKATLLGTVFLLDWIFTTRAGCWS